MRYSPDDVVNDFVTQLVLYCMRRNPYEMPKAVEDGTMTVADIIRLVRRRHGERAASSIKITMN